MAWDLMEFGEETLEKVSQPSYTFNIDSANFLAAEEFEAFKNALTLGKRVYLKLSDSIQLKSGPKNVLRPVLIGLKYTFGDDGALSLEFSNSFVTSEAAPNIARMLEQSVSMGKQLSLERENYKSFVSSHADTVLHKYMNSALDLSLQEVMSQKDQVVRINENGILIAKLLEDGSYDPHQVWFQNGSVLFTNNAWQSTEDKPGAMMGIGHFIDENLGGVDGVIAPNVVGTLLAGENLIIQSTKPDGTHMSFTVDGSGVTTYNSHQQWLNTDEGGIAIDPNQGMFVSDGENPLYQTVEDKIVPYFWRNGKVQWKDDGRPGRPHVPVGTNFYIDMRGNIYMNGSIYGESGYFKGDVYANDFYFGTGDSAKLLFSKLERKIDGVSVSGPSLDLSSLDYIDLGGMVLDGREGSTGIRFKPGYTPIKYQFGQAATGPWHDTMQTNDKYRRDSLDGGTTWGEPYQFRGTDGKNGSDASVTYDNMLKALQKAEGTKTSFITADEVGAPTIYGAKIYGAEIYAGGVNNKGGQVIGLTDGGIEIFNGYGDQIVIISRDAQGYPDIRAQGFVPLTVHGFNLALGGDVSVWFSTPKVDFTQVTTVDFTGVNVIGAHYTLA